MLKFAGGRGDNCEGQAGCIIITNRLNNIMSHIVYMYVITQATWEIGICMLSLNE